MKKCAQCGSDYPLSNDSCPKCGYNASSFGKTSGTDSKTGKIVLIVVIVFFAITLISSIAFMGFAKGMFKSILGQAEEMQGAIQDNMDDMNNGEAFDDFNNQIDNIQDQFNDQVDDMQDQFDDSMKNDLTEDECKDKCNGQYVYTNGVCVCVNTNF